MSQAILPSIPQIFGFQAFPSIAPTPSISITFNPMTFYGNGMPPFPPLMVYLHPSQATPESTATSMVARQNLGPSQPSSEAEGSAIADLMKTIKSNFTMAQNTEKIQLKERKLMRALIGVERGLAIQGIEPSIQFFFQKSKIEIGLYIFEHPELVLPHLVSREELNQLVNDLTITLVILEERFGYYKTKRDELSRLTIRIEQLPSILEEEIFVGSPAEAPSVETPRERKKKPPLTVLRNQLMAARRYYTLNKYPIALDHIKMGLELLKKGQDKDAELGFKVLEAKVYLSYLEQPKLRPMSLTVADLNQRVSVLKGEIDGFEASKKTKKEIQEISFRLILIQAQKEGVEKSSVSQGTKRKREDDIEVQPQLKKAKQ